MRLEARDLAIGHGRTRIGEGLSLSVAPGDILCLLGPNGCGKTTLSPTARTSIRALSDMVKTVVMDVHGDRP